MSDSISEVREKVVRGEYPFLSVLDESTVEIKKQAEEIRSKFENLIVFGTGGSSLGGQVLVDLKRNALGRLDKTQIYFADNVDPETLGSLFESVDVARTCFLFVSKSGGTLETISQFLALVSFLKPRKQEQIISSNFLVLTEPKKSALREIAEKFGIKIIEHHTAIGGRYSVFSNVGLLPAAVAGVDIDKVLAGAKKSIRDGFDKAAEGAVLAKESADKGRNISVLMAYKDKLKSLTRWYGQLWAESVGKDGRGTTPVSAIGTVDQHSQLQLYLDGPDDKLYTIIYCEEKNDNLKLDSDSAVALSETKYLSGKDMGEVLHAEAVATAEAIINRKRPCRVMKILAVDEESVGGLLAHFMLETVIGAALFGVNAFDQPAVEEGKIIARKMLGGV